MRIFLSIPLLLILFSCNSASTYSQFEKNNTSYTEKVDTIVGVLEVPFDINSKYILNEYYVIIKQDTSTSSCIFIKYLESGNLIMKYRNDPYQKVPNLPSNDTAVLSRETRIKNSSYKLKYQDQIRDLKLILNKASKDFDMSKLRHISLLMSSIDKLSGYVTDQYKSKYGEHFRRNTYGNTAGLIRNSFFIADLNKILAPYLLIVDDISIDGLDLSWPSTEAQKYLFNGIVIIKLARTSNP